MLFPIPTPPLPETAAGTSRARELSALFVGSRAGLLLLSLIAIRAFPINTYNRDHNAAFAVPTPPGAAWHEPPTAPTLASPPVSRSVEPPWIAIWARWDALWYSRIAEIGYAGHFASDAVHARYGEPPATGFYPLMPMLMRGLAPIAGSALRAGLILSNLCLLGSVWLLSRLTRRLVGEEAAFVAAALLLVYPPAFFLSAPYADSLGLFLSLASLSLGLDGRFVAAGSCGFLAALSRPTGILLAPALVLQWWQSRRRDSRKTGWSGAFASLLPLAGMSIFLLWCGRTFGDPWAPFHRQESWRGTITWPPRVWNELSSGPLELLATRRSMVEVAAATLFLGLGVLAFRYVPAPFALYGLGATLLPLSTSLFSFSRLALASFPVFMTAGALLRGRLVVARALEAFFVLGLGAFAIVYFTWGWIG